MEHMRRVAFTTAMRACGFAALGIFCLMVALSFDPKLALQVGGASTLLLALVLLLKAYEARTKNYRRTEMWLYLSKEQRPPEAYAQSLSATVLRDTYMTLARWTCGIAIALLTFALIASLLPMRQL